jgi:hypothetical protein
VGGRDCSPAGSAEFKNMWRFTSTPPDCLYGVVLSHRDFTTVLPFTFKLQFLQLQQVLLKTYEITQIFGIALISYI